MLSPDCYSSISSICSCSTSFCSKCSSFIEQLEFSTVSHYLGESCRNHNVPIEYLQMFTEDQLSKLYDCATTSERLPNEFADGEKDFKKLIQYGNVTKMSVQRLIKIYFRGIFQSMPVQLLHRLHSESC